MGILLVKTIIAGISFILICLAIFTAYILHNEIRLFIIRWITNFTIWNNKRVLRRQLLKRFNKVLKRKQSGQQISALDIIFETFTHFYEQYFSDASRWKLPSDLFPNDVADLGFMYKWIIHTRHMNLEEYKQLSVDENGVEYYGARFDDFNFQIDKYGALHIMMISNETRKHNPQLKYLKLTNALFDLDTKQSTWILERRASLKI